MLKSGYRYRIQWGLKYSFFLTFFHVMFCGQRQKPMGASLRVSATPSYKMSPHRFLQDEVEVLDLEYDANVVCLDVKLASVLVSH